MPPYSSATRSPDAEVALPYDEVAVEILSLRPGLPGTAPHDYKRNGTTTWFAALEVATGKLIDKCYDQHGKAE